MSPENSEERELAAEFEKLARRSLARNPQATPRSLEEYRKAILTFMRELPSEPEDTPPPTENSP
jgi:hypothetical protein